MTPVSLGQVVEREPPLWVVGTPPDWLEQALAGQRLLARYPSLRDAADDLSWRRPQIILMGGPRQQQPELLAAVAAIEGGKPKVIACGAGLRSADAAEDRSEIYYELHPPVGPEQLSRLLETLVRRSNLRELLPSGEGLGLAEQAFAAARNLAAEHSPAGMARVMEQETARLAGAARARCLLFDEHEGVLWREDPTEELELRPPQGLAGWCAVTQETRLNTAQADAHYRREVDDPQGSGGESLLVVPVSDHRGECHAVLIAVRSAEQLPFDDRARRLVQSLAKAFAPHLSQLSFEAAVARRRLGELAERLGSNDMFREEALAAYAEPRASGQVLRISRRMDAIFWVLLAISAWAAAFVALVRVPTYSEGSAVVRLGKDVEITAPSAGRVERLLVAPGAPVRRGAPLVYLFGDAERAELERAELEWAAALRMYLADPGSSGASLLLSAQAQRDAQRGAIERKRVLAPYDGVLSEHRVRVGQAVQAGQVLIAVVPPESRAYVMAALPGNDHARLRAGQLMHLELEGHRRVSIDVTIDSVSAGVLGAAEVRELLGAASEPMQLPGAVTLVTAPLSTTTFQDRDGTYVLSHGMLTRASVEVSSDTLLDLLLPDVRRTQ